MPSRRSAWSWLIEKEVRELASSRAWWVLALVMGPLVGVSFISAVRTYAEASGLNGTAVGVGEAFSPLVGVWAPTFSACELAAAFLLPFVAIRLVAGDRQSGALKLELQHAMPSAARVAAKAGVLVAGWLVASVPVVIAAGLWLGYGGHLYWPELGSVALGHVVNAGLTIALGAAAASVAEHPSTAAILTLTVTVGTWILNFVAAVHGGWWERAAGYTPTAMVAAFQHGLVQLDVLLIGGVLTAAGLLLASIWLRLGTAVRRRVFESMSLAAGAAIAVVLCTFARATWDVSENRMNSFPIADERALRRIRAPLRMVVHLAPEDPRRSDLDRRVVSKLRRVLRSFEVEYVSATSIGLFEQTTTHYGEIWYDLGGTRTASRTTTAEGVLETIETLAGVAPSVDPADVEFRGYPLAVPPKGAALTFYGIWPALVGAGALFTRRQLA